MGIAGGTSHHRRASAHVLRSLWPLEHGRVHPGLSVHFLGGRAGRFDPDLLPEPSIFFRCTFRRSDCIPAGFSDCAAHDDRRRTARYPWDIDPAPNSLGAVHVDWVAGGEVDCESVR